MFSVPKLGNYRYKVKLCPPRSLAVFEVISLGKFTPQPENRIDRIEWDIDAATLDHNKYWRARSASRRLSAGILEMENEYSSIGPYYMNVIRIPECPKRWIPCSLSVCPCSG